MSDAVQTARRVLVLDPADNVAVALADVAAGEPVGPEPGALVAREPVRAAHKLAVRAIAEGEPVVKYGEVIGMASTAIEAGSHVHVHNVSSGRLPGPGR